MPGLAAALLEDHPIARRGRADRRLQLGQQRGHLRARRARPRRGRARDRADQPHATPPRRRPAPRPRRGCTRSPTSSSTTAAAWAMPRSRSPGSAAASRRRRRWSGRRSSTRSRPRRSGSSSPAASTPEVFAQQQRRGRRRAERRAARPDGGDVSRNAPSPFAVRGVLEGFYGNPWTHEQRLEMIRVHRVARDEHVRLHAQGRSADPARAGGPRTPAPSSAAWPSWSTCRAPAAWTSCSASRPGLSMRYSDEGDLEALASKLASVAALGVSAFGLLFDDIPTELQHPEDREAFEDLADAHVAVANRVAERLGSRSRLIVCPTVYWGSGREMYLQTPGLGARARHRPVLDGAGDLLADARRRRRRRVRADRPTARHLLGQLPGQRRRDGLRAPRRALPRAGPAPVPARVRRRRQRDGAVRGVEDPVRDHRRLPRRARGVRPGEELAAGDPRRRRRGGSRRRSRSSRTTSARRASRSRTRRW